MSMHFAPQWVKPIKPTGSLVTPTSETHPQQLSKAAAPASPFPALGGQPRSGSPTTIVPPANPPLSYSRVTHTPASPSMPGDGYFPYAGGEGGPDAEPSPFPFRYSRDQILAVWDEDKIKERPIELLQLAESGAVIVSPNVVKPVGLRELSELEKKLLATSVHPPMPTRRPQTHNNNNADPASPMRRQPQAAAKDSGAAIQSPVTGRAPFGGFGRGEGGVFGGSKFSGALAEGGGGSGGGRQPGSIGGGFGGVAKRTTARRDASDNTDPQQQPRSATATTWRSARNASGTFEGVLGFGNTAASNTAATDAATNGKPDDDGGSWGAAAGQRKWRAAQQQDDAKPAEPATTLESAAPAAAAETHREVTPVQPPTSQTPQLQELGAINWYYRDPNGQEQGPFTGNQMHEWYSHSYFKDDLPIRRENETGFHSLAELKTNTGNAVQPFLSVVRPRLPPNLPIPLAALQTGAPAALPSPTLTDQFHRLNMQGLPPQQPSFLPNAPFASHYQPQFNGAPAFLAGAQQQVGWNPAPGPQTPSRMNGAFGSIGGQQFSSYGSPIGTRGPDVFGAPTIPSTIGSPSTWGAPNPAAAWQQIPTPAPIPQQFAPSPPSQVQMMDTAPVDTYFPVELQPQQQQQQAQQQQQQQQPQQQTAAEHVEPAAEPQQETEEQFPEPEHVFDTESEAVPEEEQHEEPEEVVEEEPAPVPEPVKPAPSAWGQTGKAPSRNSSVLSDATPAVSKLPPAPASLPPKPAAAPAKAAEQPQQQPTSPAAASPVTPSVERSTPKPAPWAAQTTAAPTGPSLREIQEAEARQAEARKAARAEARASASPAPVSADDHTTTLSWGLPQQGVKATIAPSPTSATPPAPAWGGAADGPKKTLKQIQEEEERRKHKQDAQARAAASAAGAATTKRGYADLAAHNTPSPAQAAAAAAQGWTTVGAAGKVTAAPPKPAPAVVSKPVAPVVSAAPAVPKPIAAAAKASNGLDNGETQPSVEFIRWTKASLTGLNVPVDDFIQMLLQFPIDPPAASRADVLEIISDSVYASSSTLDGRRFAQEFFAKRKADAIAQRTGNRPVQKVTSLADVVKTQPKTPSADLGFKVVKAKKRRN